MKSLKSGMWTVRTYVKTFKRVMINFFILVSSLECFSCDREDNNHHGCTKNTKTCLEYQDACITYIRWGGNQFICKYTYLSKHQESAYFHGNGNGHCLISIWFYFMEISTSIFLADI